MVAVTSLGPNMVLDLKRRRPMIGTPEGFAWTSGPYIKPLALATVSMVKKAVPELSVIACGGCATAQDVLEFLLAGADAVQMLTWAMLRGRTVYSKIIKRLPAELEKYGFSSIEDVKVTKLGESVRRADPILPTFDHDKCTKCGICTDNCPYFALEMEEQVALSAKDCFGCGLCESRCPVGAITGPLS